MSIHFHPLRIKEIRQETNDCISLVFDIPHQLSKDFQFKQGQSLTMRTTLNNEEVRRTYSLCSSPLDNEWRVAIKKVHGGVFSNYAHSSLKKGDTLEVMPPVGSFYTELNSTQSNWLSPVIESGWISELACAVFRRHPFESVQPQLSKCWQSQPQHRR